MSLRDVLRIDPGSNVDLTKIDPDGTPGLPRGKYEAKAWARQQLAGDLGNQLATRQEQLFASAKADPRRGSVLLILQAMDCGGKDGTVKKVAGAMNPMGVCIVGFGKPTEEELAHDFLWRIRRGLPGPGLVGVFNRSHYEDVLVARVRNLVPKRTWQARYAKINEFEREVVASRTRVVKVMLHISADEQRARLLARLTDPTKFWKYNPADIDERGRWDDYQTAYTEAFSRCSTDVAPWYVVPANRKWYRDWAVATLLRETFDQMDLAYPQASFDIDTERARLS
jgi:PPK2 family polyphosphate:nucleotide phosphotransferase